MAIEKSHTKIRIRNNVKIINSGSLANLEPFKYNQLTKQFGLLADHKDLLIDIYKLLVHESKKYYINFGLTDAESQILAVFIVQTYGNHEDFSNYLIVNKDRFNLGRNCFFII